MEIKRRSFLQGFFGALGSLFAFKAVSAEPEEFLELQSNPLPAATTTWHRTGDPCPKCGARMHEVYWGEANVHANYQRAGVNSNCYGCGYHHTSRWGDKGPPSW